MTQLDVNNYATDDSGVNLFYTFKVSQFSPNF